MIGSIRGPHFLLTRQVLDAETAAEYGVINEIVASDRLLARAHQIVDVIASLPQLTGLYTRIALAPAHR